MPSTSIHLILHMEKKPPPRYYSFPSLVPGLYGNSSEDFFTVYYSCKQPIITHLSLIQQTFVS